MSVSTPAELGDLLLAWEEAREKGRDLPPEQLCRNRPELLPALKKQIAALEKINPWLRMKRSAHTIAIGPATGLNSEIQRMLHARLRIAGSILLVASLVGFPLALLDPLNDALLDWVDYLSMSLVIVLTAAPIVPLFTRWQPSLRQLRILELVFFGTAVVLVSWMQNRLFQKGFLAEIPSPGHERRFARMLSQAFGMPWLILMVMYGMFIPNSWRRCALVVGCIWACALLVFVLIALHSAPFREYLLGDGLLSTIVGLGFGAVVAVYGSHKISALQQEAFEARRLGQYHLTKKLGAGGMGEVYLAEHQLLRRPCAVKLIRPERAGDRRLLERFEREVRAMATLTHWNTVDIYDYGHAEDGTFYYVMEYLPGLTLEQIVERHGPLPPGRTIHFLRQVCNALNEAHAIGLIHRDIKPGNIIICERGQVYDVVKLLDFGLVKATRPGAHATKLTLDGFVPGTPLYMSPEQAADVRSLDARSDLSSLGAVGYYLLTGRPPFVRATVMQVFAAHVGETPVPLRELRADTPADLEAVILSCLEKDPARRFPDARSLVKALACCTCAGEWSQEEAADWWKKHYVKGVDRTRDGGTTASQC